MREIFDSTVERLLSDLVTTELVLACERGQWPAELWSAVEESGFTLAMAPESQGGAGATWAEVCGVVQLAGRHNLPLPLPDAMFANWLLGISGLAPFTEALSFAATGTLKLEGGKVSGIARDVPWGRQVKYAAAVATGESLSVVLLPTEAAALAPSTNTAAEPRDTLEFQAIAPLAVASLPAGFSADILKLGGAMLRSAQIAGALEGVLAMVTNYANERVQFGKPVGSFQAIQHQIALLAEHASASAMAAEAAFAESDGRLACLPVMAAKICASEAAGIGASVAHGVHGAIGFTHEHALHLTTRRLWSWRSEFGSLTDWSQQLGRAICAAGSGAFWPTITNGQLENLKEATA